MFEFLNSDGRNTVVFASYNGSSQILPYLERLHVEWPIWIMSFERPDRLGDHVAVSAMEQRLSAQGIRWSRLRYHKWPSLAATTYDLLRGMAELRRIAMRTRIALVHSRSYVTNTMVLNALPSTPFLFDIRGLQADEYVDGGVWKRGELKWRLAKSSERRFFRRADAAVVLTNNIREHVTACFRDEGRAPLLEVIPCCVDLERFTFADSDRKSTRASLSIPEEATVFVYSGSLGTWYLSDEMARFVRRYAEQTGEKVVLLWLVNNDQPQARRASAQVGLTDSQVRFVSAAPKDVPRYLAAADVGLALIKQSFSKRSSSPTKYAEYLSMGMPVVISRDVGDGAVIAERDGGVALHEFDDVAFDAGVQRLTALREAPRSQFRKLAEALFDVETVAVPAYRRLYRGLIRS